MVVVFTVKAMATVVIGGYGKKGGKGGGSGNGTGGGNDGVVGDNMRFGNWWTNWTRSNDIEGEFPYRHNGIIGIWKNRYAMTTLNATALGM